MATFKYTYDRSARHVAINVSANPNYGGVKTEQEARVACARKIDGEIADVRARLAKEVEDLEREISILAELRNSVYVGELPPVPEPAPKPQA